MTLKRTVRYYWLKFRRLQGDPRKVARGMALGVFIGFTPTMPFHTIMALGLAAFFRVSPVAAYLGIWVCNPLTMVPIYVLAYEVGRVLLFRGDHLVFPNTLNLHSILQLLYKGGLALQVGGIIIAVPPAVAAYFVTLWTIQRYRRRQAAKAPRVLSVSQKSP